MRDRGKLGEWDAADPGGTDGGEAPVQQLWELRAANRVTHVKQQPLPASGRVLNPLGERSFQGVVLDPVDGVDEGAPGGGGTGEVVGAVDPAQERALGDSAMPPALDLSGMVTLLSI